MPRSNEERDTTRSDSERQRRKREREERRESQPAWLRVLALIPASVRSIWSLFKR